jgi:hypothetical protein
MKLPIAIATLFLATSTALPAFAAPNGHYFYSHQQGYRTANSAYAAARRPPVANGYNAYASHEAASRSANTRWPCIHRSRQESGLDSAYPDWEECN